jgi:hypothetical protein
MYIFNTFTNIDLFHGNAIQQLHVQLTDFQMTGIR